jgi:hypothetical protein
VLEDIKNVSNVMSIQNRWTYVNATPRAVTTAAIDPNGSYYVAGAVDASGANFPTPLWPAPNTGAMDGYMVNLSPLDLHIPIWVYPLQ